MAAFLAATVCCCSAQQPDPVEVINAAIANAQKNLTLSQTYTYESVNDWRYYNKNGVFVGRDSRTFDNVFVSGDWYLRLIARNGRPLAGKEAEREQRNWDDLMSRVRARLVPEQKRRSLFNFTIARPQRFRTQAAREPIPFEDLPRLFDLQLTGVEDVQGHPAYVIEATPRATAKAADKWEEAELHDQVKVWIDVAERTVVRLHLDVLSDRPLVSKGSSVDVEWARINNEVWMLTHCFIQFPAPHGEKVVDRSQFEMTASNFRKFDVTSRVLPGPVVLAPAEKAASSPAPNIQPPEEATVRSIVQKGFDAYQRGDFRALFALFSQESPHLLAGKVDIENNSAYYGKDEIKNLNVDHIEIATDTATVRLSFERRSTEPGRTQGRRFFTFQLVREQGTWKLWSGESDETEFARALLAAEDNAERELMLAGEPQLVTEELADQLVGLGNGWVSMGDYLNATASFQLAQRIAERLGDKGATWKALYGLGHGDLVQGNVAEADEDYRKSLAICQEPGNLSDLSFLLYQIGRDYTERGDYNKGMEHYQRSLAIGAGAGKERIASTLEALGDLFMQQGNDEQALEQYRKALKLFEELEAGVEVKLKVTTSLGKIADALTRQGNYKQALDYYQKNLALLKELDAATSSALILRKIGDNYALQDLLAQALENYQKSLKIFQEEQHKPGIAATLERIAALHSRRGEYDLAVTTSRQALELAEALDDPSQLSRIQTTLGQACLAAHQYDQARFALEAAISNIEKLRTQVAGTERDRERFFESRLNPYHSMVELLIQQHDFQGALRFAELAKARVLYEILGKGKERITGNMSAEERRQERALSQVLITLNSQLEQERLQRHPSSVLLSSLEAQVKKARLAEEAFETAVYAAHPELKVQRGESQPVSLEEIGSLMTDASTAFLEYVVTRERTYLFVLTPDSGSGGNALSGVHLNVYPIAIRSRELALSVAGFRDRLARDALDFRTQSRQLYNLLLGPAQKELAGKKTLCLVPSGPLWELPFQALVSAGSHYLLEEHAVFYVPSLSVLREMRKKKQAAGSETSMAAGERDADINASDVLLAVANPDLANSAGLRTNVDALYAPLPEQEQLVRTLAQIYGPKNTKILTGKAAREEAVKTLAGNYKILHFATHGILDDDDPLYSGLLLSTASKEEDGFLEAREIMQMELRASVAVLSACETARGKIHQGEGVMGMSWALFVAGTPTILVSQWKIDSASTARLMTVFHRALANGMLQSQLPTSKAAALMHPRTTYRLLRSQASGKELRTNTAEALRQAALRLMAEPRYAHPFYWAGFVVVGDGF
ncbi:MAG TPA: CHAT domain-containing protein [Candidatus Angelobacter sp.]|nr:CHAT domain-containing protein [Candidatus Angelobacter sp.]